MKFEDAVSSRSRFDTIDGALRFRRRNNRNWFVIVFLIAWLGGWAMGEGFAISELVGSTPRYEFAFLAFWLVAWTIGGFSALAFVVWMLFGAESVSPTALALRHSLWIGPLHYDRNYKASTIENIRWRDGNSGPAFAAGRGVKPSAILADYGSRTIEFLRGIEEAEARQVIGQLDAVLGTKRRRS